DCCLYHDGDDCVVYANSNNWCAASEENCVTCASGTALWFGDDSVPTDAPVLIATTAAPTTAPSDGSCCLSVENGDACSVFAGANNFCAKSEENCVTCSDGAAFWIPGFVVPVAEPTAAPTAAPGSPTAEPTVSPTTGPDETTAEPTVSPTTGPEPGDGDCCLAVANGDVCTVIADSSNFCAESPSNCVTCSDGNAFWIIAPTAAPTAVPTTATPTALPTSGDCCLSVENGDVCTVFADSDNFCAESIANCETCSDGAAFWIIG
ncbi:hypothetical protein M885DRAFT_565536, partial [Pelagophyceae sp. CCMP2097]